MINHTDRRLPYLRLTLYFWTIALLVIGLIIFWTDLLLFSDAVIYLLLWVLICGICIIFVINISFSKKIGSSIDIFELPIYLSFVTLILISLFGIIPYIDNDYLSLRLFDERDMLSGLLLTGVGLISLWIGYGIIVLTSKRINTEKKEIPWLNLKNPPLFKTLILYIILIIFRLYLVLLGGGESYHNVLSFGVWDQWITYIVESRWLFIALFVIQILSQRWPRWLLLFIIFAESSLSILAGWSGNFIDIGLLIFGCSVYVKKPIKIQSLIFGIFLLLLITPVIRSSREALRFSSIGYDRAFSESTQESIDVGIGSTLFSSFDLLFRRQSLVAQTPTIIMNYTPSIIPYRPVSELLITPLTVIPRILWPDKPVFADTYSIITQDYLGLSKNTGASAPTIVGNAYMYGGWAVVICGMIIIGIIFGLIYKYLVIPALSNKDIAILSLYSGFIVANFHIGEGDFVSIWQGLVQRGIVFLFILLVLCIRNKGPNKSYNYSL